MAVKKPTDALSKFILSYWNGEQPLWSAFWVYFLFIGLCLDALWGPAFIESMQQSDGSFVSCWVHIAGILVGIMYTVWNFVSVWRCAKNTEKPLWGMLARGVYVLMIVIGLLFWLGPWHKMMWEPGFHEPYGMMGWHQRMMDDDMPMHHYWNWRQIEPQSGQ